MFQIRYPLVSPLLWRAGVRAFGFVLRAKASFLYTFHMAASEEERGRIRKRMLRSLNPVPKIPWSLLFRTLRPVVPIFVPTRLSRASGLFEGGYAPRAGDRVSYGGREQGLYPQLGKVVCARAPGGASLHPHSLSQTLES